MSIVVVAPSISAVRRLRASMGESRSLPPAGLNATPAKSAANTASACATSSPSVSMAAYSRLLVSPEFVKLSVMT